MTARVDYLFIPPTQLPGNLEGLGYGATSVPFPGVFDPVANLVPATLFQTILEGDALPGRMALVNLPGTLAAYPQMSDAANESFRALQTQGGIGDRMGCAGKPGKCLRAVERTP